jgi:hypothetical protein
MKKVKLMLLSFSVLSVVAGALAFKARTGLDYCTAPTKSTNPSTACAKKCPTRHTNLKEDNTATFICTAPTTGSITPCQVSGVDIDCSAASVQVKPE